MIAHSDIAYVIDPRGHARYIIDANPGPGTQATRSSFSVVLAPPSAARWTMTAPLAPADERCRFVNYVSDNWSYDPFLIVVAVVVALHELGLHNLRRRSRAADAPEPAAGSSLLFYGGLAVLLVAVVSPIDYWADDYFFVHMIEHILIMFFAPILIVAGAPWLPLVHGLPGRGQAASWDVPSSSVHWARPLRALGRFLPGGLVAVVAFNVAMVIWHVPRFLRSRRDETRLSTSG